MGTSAGNAISGSTPESLGQSQWVAETPRRAFMSILQSLK